MRLALLTVIAAAVAALVAPTAQALPAREIAGVALHPWRMENADVRERTFAAVSAAGVRWARVDLRWNGVERDRPELASGHANWSTMDAIVDAANRHGVTLLPIVAYTPAWASTHGTSWAFPSEQAFEEFFSAALRRYPGIPAWEIWNEPNLGVFAQPAPDPAGFVRLLRSAGRARDRVGSDAKLISGGLSPGGEIDIVGWVEDMARRDALGLIDGLGVHPYGGGEPDDPGAWMMQLEALHARLAALGRPELPLWLTEYGAPSSPVPNAYAPPLTEEQQAQHLRRAFALAERFPWVENLTWFEYRDSCADLANPECNFGLVRQDLTPKAAYYALGDVVAGATSRLRPRLTMSARRNARAPRRLTVRGRLLLPGSLRPTTRVMVRLLSSAARPLRSRVAVRKGVFSARLDTRRTRGGVVEVRYPGSKIYEPVLARSRVKARRDRGDRARR